MQGTDRNLATDFPSSPPLFPQEVPTFPQNFDNSRVTLHDIPHTSSDPPLFSSDDSPESAGIENYESPRVKKKRKGAWWDASPPNASESLKKKKFERNFDSGIWISSDDTVEDTDMRITSTKYEPRFGPSKYEHLYRRDVDKGEAAVTEPVLETPVPPGFPADKPNEVEFQEISEQIRTAGGGVSYWGESEWVKQEVVRQAISRGVQNNSQSYDLSYRMVSYVEDASLEQLHQVIRPPHDPGNREVGEEYYASMNPEITVQLSHNLLRDVPIPLLSLEYLTHLYLRGNNIEELPPQICRLPHLKSLNVSANKLRWLPSDMMRLLGASDKQIVVEPNPFLSLLPDIEILCNQANTSTMAETSVFSSPVYYDKLGCLLPSSPRPFSGTEEVVEAMSKKIEYPLQRNNPADITSARPKGGAPSLFELAFRTMLSYGTTKECGDMLGDMLSPHIKRGLDIAEKRLRLTGSVFNVCGCCGSRHIITRAEWFEFFKGNVLEDVPFKWEVCSPECVLEHFIPPNMTMKEFRALANN